LFILKKYVTVYVLVGYGKVKHEMLAAPSIRWSKRERVVACLFHLMQ